MLYRDPLVAAGLKIADLIKEGIFSEDKEKERTQTIGPADGEFENIFIIMFLSYLSALSASKFSNPNSLM